MRESDYDKMVRLMRYKDDRETAYRLAEKLRNTPEGVDAAVADLSVSGGRSRGLGSWILITSSLAGEVEPKLKAIAASPRDPLNRRVEAVWILWLRTNDLVYLQQLFDLVKSPDGFGIAHGRGYLRKSFIETADDIRAKLDVGEGQQLPLTMEEFKQLIRKPGVIFREKHEGAAKPSKSPTDERSLDERVADLEQFGNASKPRFSADELRRQYQENLAEIQRLGLVARVEQDFHSRLPNATVTSWTFGYFVDTNTVWCDVRYSLPGREEAMQKEFGYTRKTGTNWSLIWETNSTP
jgi:hypothetical protein